MFWLFSIHMGCQGPAPLEEPAPTDRPGPRVQGGGPKADPEDCLDGVDNDADGRVDCEDADCAQALHCFESDCADVLDNDDDGLLDCQDDDCWHREGCATEREVTLLGGEIWRRHISKTVVWPDTSSHETHFVSFLTMQGTVRTPQPPALLLSTATSIESCAFALRSWEMAFVMERRERQLVTAQVGSPAALSFAPECDHLSPAAFLPAHQRESGWQVMLGQHLYPATDSQLGQSTAIWFEGSSKSRSELTTDWYWTSHNNAFLQTYFLRRSFIGQVQGVSPFMWTPHP